MENAILEENESISTYTEKNKSAKDKENKGRYSAYEPGPYEIVMEAGEQALTDAQLLAVILRTGIPGIDATELAGKILSECDSDRGLSGLNRLSVADMMSIDGIGKVKAIQLKCLCEISRRMGKRSDFRKLDFSRAGYVAEHYMQDMAHLDHEKVIVVLLDSRLKYVRECVISVGSCDMAYVNPRDIFFEVLRWRASSFVLLHNHPSGDPEPSIADISLTKRVEEGATVLGLKLADHIVIGNNCYYSMRGEGLLCG